MLIKRSVGEGRFVYFTDEPDRARQIAQSGFAVVGICYPRPEDWSGISYILELEDIRELDELEDWYVQEVWCRHKKEALIIGTFFIESLDSNVCLREMKVEDVDKLYTLYEDEAIKLWITPLNSDKNVEKEKIKSYIQNIYGMYGCGMWILELEKTGEIIGRVGMEPCDGELYIGYLIAEKMRGKHIAEKACKLSLEYVKNRLEPEEIWCKIAEGNIASIKLAEKLGFELNEIRETVRYYKFHF